jgi:hypothetical protein
MYMLQQQSDAIASSTSAASINSSDEESDNDEEYPDDNFADEEKADALQVSSVDSLFATDPDNNRSSGALIMAGKRPSKPDRINLRSRSEQEADDRLDNEYGLSPPTKLSRDFSDGFRVPIAKIKTMFDSTKESDIRYHHLHPPPPSLERNTSDNLVDLELAPGQRRHGADVPSVSWDLSKTAWSQHIQQSAFDASSRPPGDWEAPSNEVVHERFRSKWQPVKYTKRQLCWWFWQILFAIAGAVILIVLLTKSKSS